MNKSILTGTVILATFAVAGGLYMTVPTLQNDRAVVGRQVREGIARARRLLARVHDNQERLAVVLDGLRAAGVARLDDDQIDEMVEADRELLTAAEDRLGEIAAQTRTRRQRLANDYAFASELPLPTLRGTIGANLPQLTKAIREGLAARDRLLAENTELLDQALKALRQGMSAQAGDVDGTRDPAALNMEGIILYAQGTSIQRQAILLRHQAIQPRSDLIHAAAQHAQRQSEQNIQDKSGLEGRIVEVTTKLTAKQQQLAQLEQRLRTLQGTMADLEARLAKAQAAADQARQALDALASLEINPGDSASFQAFADDYSRESATFRHAVARVRVIQFGSLDNARIDDTGDYITGQYVPANGGDIKPQPGLYHHRQALDVLQTQVDQTTQLVQGLQSDAQAMQQAQASQAERSAESAKLAGTLWQRASALYETMMADLDQAWELEDTAVQRLDLAIRKFAAASQAHRTNQSDARASLSGLAADAATRMPAKLYADDRWPPAANVARQGDAKLRLAMIHYERFRDLLLQQELLSRLGEATPDQIDLDALTQDLETSQEAGLAAAEECIDALFKASQDMNQHFALTAQIASAYYLQSLFGDPKLAIVAMRNYEIAIQGRETSPFVTQYVERLAQIKRMRLLSKSLTTK